MHYKIIFTFLVMTSLCVFIHTSSFCQVTTPAEYERIRKSREADEARRRQQATEQEYERQKKEARSKPSPPTVPVTAPSKEIAAFKPKPRSSYDEVGPFDSGYNTVRLKNKWGVIDNFDVVVVPIVYDLLIIWPQSYMGALRYGKWGYVSTTGQVVIDFEFDSLLEGFTGGQHPMVTKDGFQFRINNRGERVSDKIAINPPKAVAEIQNVPLVTTNSITPLSFFEGFAKTEVNDKWGFRNQSGIMIVPAIYDDVIRFMKGVAAVQSGGNWGFVDTSGRVIIPIIYSEANYTETKDRVLTARTSTGWGLINYKGETIAPFKYDQMGYLLGSEKLISVSLKEKWGCINSSGILTIPIIYEKPLYFWKGYSPIVSLKKHGVINENGDIVAPLLYVDIRQDAGGVYGKLNDNWVDLELPPVKE